MDHQLNCAIVDDDRHAIDLIAQLASKHPYLNIVKTFTNPLHALAGIGSGIDLLFLDIDMPGLNGLELAALLRAKVDYLIFVTAHEQFALPAYEVSADQYLIKPVSEIDFFKAISRLNRAAAQGITAQLEGADDGLMVKYNLKGHFSRIEKADIICVETIPGTNYVRFITRQKTYKTYLTLRSLQHTLKDDSRFMRISRSVIIRLPAIMDIKGNTLVLEGEKEVSIGDEYRGNFMRYVQSKLSNS